MPNRRTSSRKLAPIHPGEVLRHDFLEPLEITAYRLAHDTGLPQSRVGAILRGERSVTAETALTLGVYFRTTPEFWLNLQSRYDLAIVEDAQGRTIRDRVRPASERAA